MYHTFLYRNHYHRSCFWYPDFHLFIPKEGRWWWRERCSQGSFDQMICTFFFVQNGDADEGGDDDEGGAPIEEYLTIIVCSFKPRLRYLHCILQTTITTTVLHINDIYNRQTEHFNKLVCGYKPGLRYLHRIQQQSNKDDLRSTNDDIFPAT